PLLIVTQPINNQVFNTNEITVSGTATDSSGILSVTVDGNPVTVSSTGSFSSPLILANGSNTITIIVTDASPNANVATVTRIVTYTPPVVADTTPPLLIVIQPINNQVFNTNEITVSGTAIDASGILSVTVNDNAVEVGETGSFSTTVYLSPGGNTIKINATDASANKNYKVKIRTVTFTPIAVDTTPPLLIVSQPINGQNFITNSITVDGYVSDESGINSVTVNGAPATISGNSFSFILTLNNGTNTIEVEAIDSSSNYNRINITRTVIYTPPVVLDTTPPSLVVNQPTNGQDFVTNLITVSGSAYDSSGIYSVSVNGAIIAVGAGTFSTNVYLTPGTNTITVAATDGAGQTASANRTVTYTLPVVSDSTPPLLIVSQPRNDQNFETNSIIVSGTAYDASGLYSVTINGNDVSLSSTGSFSSTVYLVNGSNSITVSATDASTNANTATITRTATYTPPVVADTAPPLLILNQPNNDQVFTTSPITVSGKATDDSGIRSVTVNGVPAILTEDGTFGISVDLNIGSNTIEIQAIDYSSNLNINTTTLTVTRIIPSDNEPPVLIVTMPDEGLVIQSSNNITEVQGTASDATGLDSITVNGNSASIDDGSFSASVSLIPGQNLIRIIATDNSTNHNSRTITRNVTYIVPISGPGNASNISLDSNPPALNANGRHKANIVAHVTDANGIDVADGTNISFVTSDGMLYRRHEDVESGLGNTSLTVQTRNGTAIVVLISSTTPGMAVVTAKVLTNGIPTTLNVPFKATSTLKDKSDDTTLIITHSPSFPADNSSIELNGGIGSMRTSTETAIGIVNGTRISYNIGTATIDIVIINPIIIGDQVLFTVYSVTLNSSTIASNFTGIGYVASHVNVGLNTTSQLRGMTFVMSLHPTIADDLRTRGGADAGIVDLNTTLTNLESALDIQNVENITAFVTSAQLDGATDQDILEVPISMTVSGNWYRNYAASTPGNVRLVKIYSNGTVGMIQAPQSFAFDPVNDSYTFVFRMRDFSTFALIGTAMPTPPITPTPTPPVTPTPTPTPIPGTIDVPLPIDPATGTINTTINITVPSANVTLTIPNGTKAVDANGNATTNISINTSESLTTNARFALSANDIVLGHVVELKPEGTRFDPPIQIRFNYSLPLPSGVNEDGLTVRYFNVSTNIWEDMQTVERNTAQHYIIANIPHFSTFALIGTAIPGSGSSGGGGGGGYVSPTQTSKKTTEPAEEQLIPPAAPAMTVAPVSTYVPQKETVTVTPQEKTYTISEWLASITGLFLPSTKDVAGSSWIYALILLVIIAVAVHFNIAKKKGGK
ncbi:MAG: hypothetical protein OIN85_05430, partial [Candidatus Methanoperedens sp.]|nr:hypothetical protein [Candidatus Methanoperedens sp.]